MFNYLTILFAILAVGMDCRSMTTSNFNQAIEGFKSHEATRRQLSPDASDSEDLDNDVVNLTHASREYVDELVKDFPAERLILAQGASREKSSAEILAKSVNVTSEEEIAERWLNELESTLYALRNGSEIEKSDVNGDTDEMESTLHEGNRSFVVISGDNWLEDLQDFLNEQYETESSEDNENRVRWKPEDSSTSRPSDQRDPNVSDGMVAEFQNDASTVRGYFGKLCRKHRTAT